jgi:arabinofuranan 3-O-arabinosyltransferase
VQLRDPQAADQDGLPAVPEQGGQAVTPPPPDPPAARRLGPVSERGWVLLVWLAALGIFLATATGRMIFDTKLGVDIDAAGFYARLWPLWNPLDWFGTLQDQYIGYAVPMAPFFLVGQLAQLPVWIIERLWLSLLVAAAFWGMIRLAAALRIGSPSSRLLAAAAFALWPTFTIVIGSTSAAILPGVLTPWALLPLVSATAGRSPPWLAAARSGVAIVAMGGVNATSTLSALVLPALYLVTHGHGRRRVSLGLWWAAAATAATAWWLIPLVLQGRYSFNFLPYVEQAATTTGTASAAAFLRGSSNWTAYFNLGTPWLAAGWAMVTAPLAILASAAAAATGLYGLARRDMPERRWLCLSLALAAGAALAGYGGALGGPAHATVDQLLNGPLAPLRSIYKLEPAAAAVLALGCAHAMAQCWQRGLHIPGRRRRTATRVVTAPLVALALAGLALPYLSGQILQQGSFPSVPSYWHQVAGYLAVHSPAQTALVIPADAHGQYVWGNPIDDPLQALASSPWAERGLVPYGGAGSQTLLDTAETAFESGEHVPGLAAFLGRAGIRYVVVRNDLSPAMLGYVAPQLVHETLALSGFRRVAAFGPVIAVPPLDPEPVWPAPGSRPGYPAVEVYQAVNPAQRPAGPASVLPVSATVLVNGGPDALLQLAGQHLLTSGQPAVIAGQPLAGPPSLWAVTDAQRRADNAFGLVNSNISFTYTASQDNPVDDPLGAGGQPPGQLLPVPAAGHQTVAVLSGAAQVSASSYGSWLTEEPQAGPVSAFDGNPRTAWTEGSATTPVGQWIQITFGHPMALPDHIGIQLLDDIPGRSVANQLLVSTAAGSAATTVLPTNATQRLAVVPGRTRWLRITITGASGVMTGNPGAGIRDVLIPGLRVTTYLKPPQDAAGRQAAASAFSFQLQSPMISDQSSPVTGFPLARTFSTAGAERLVLSATATARPGSALEAIFSRLAPPGPNQLAVSASSTWDSDPAFGPDNLFSSGGTPWISGSATAVLRLSWHRRHRITRLVLTPGFTLPAPTRVRIGSPAGFRDANVGPAGVVWVTPPLRTNRLYLAFPGMQQAPTDPATGLPARPAIGLARLSVPALSRLRLAAPAASARFALGCGQGPVVTIDRQRYQSAVSGTVGQLLHSLPVQVRLCTAGSAVNLAPGRHWLLAAPTPVFTITGMSLRREPAGPATTAVGPATTAVGPATAAAGGQPAGAPAQAAGQPAIARPRSVTVASWQPDSRALRIGPGPRSYLEIHQNANPGWVATMNGRRLTPARLDGWQQAFLVPAGRGGLISLDYLPAGIYHAGIVVSALLLLLLLLAAAAGFRRRGSPPRPGQLESTRPTLTAADGQAPGSPLPAAAEDITRPALTAADGQAPGSPLPAAAEDITRPALSAASTADRALPPSGTTRLASPAARQLACVILLTALVYLIGGPVALAVPVLAVVARRWPSWLPVIAFCAMLLAGLVAASATQPTAPGSGAFSGAAQACALIALAAALLPVITSGPGWRPAARRGGS